jgi:probable phosphoglycerate mutase
MRLVLVRHGDAFAGFNGIVDGPNACRGLTDLGRRQAEALRDHLRDTGRLRADAIVSSTLPRAIETATIIAPGLSLEIGGQHADLCELHTGVAEGLEWAEYTQRYGSFDMRAEPDRVYSPEGESWHSFHDRVRSMLERVAREHVDQTVVAVCHAGVIVASLRVLFGFPQLGTDAQLRPTNTGLTEWRHDAASGQWTLHSFNETAHLASLDTPA